MDAEGLKELFEPFGPVTVKRMFGGSGLYAEGLCFAIECGAKCSSRPTLCSQAGFRGRRLDAIRLCGEGQVEADVLLEPARGRA